LCFFFGFVCRFCRGSSKYARVCRILCLTVNKIHSFIHKKNNKKKNDKITPSAKMKDKREGSKGYLKRTSVRDPGVMNLKLHF
jgi:hypothetical protein